MSFINNPLNFHKPSVIAENESTEDRDTDSPTIMVPISVILIQTLKYLTSHLLQTY